MRIDRNVTFFAGGGNDEKDSRHVAGVNQNRKSNSISIFGGNLSVGEDKILMKKKQAQKQALKVVGDTWDNNRKVDSELDERREHLKKATQEYANAQKNLKELENREEELRSQYGVEADSQEQMDLELLKKREASLNGKEVDFTEEEMERLGQIDQQGPTEYQIQCMDISQRKNDCQKIAADSERTMIEENAVIRGIRKERLKDTSMVEAAEQAKEIKEAASQEIVGMLMEEAKEHIDEEMKKKEEQAEKIKEEKEEKEELLEKSKEKKEEEEIEVTTEEILTLDETGNDFKKEMQNIVDKMNLVAEDIKGSVVDQSV